MVWLAKLDRCNGHGKYCTCVIVSCKDPKIQVEVIVDLFSKHVLAYICLYVGINVVLCTILHKCMVIHCIRLH